MKRCPYCQHLKPEATFHYLSKGRGGRVTVAQCDDCYQGRKNPDINKAILEAMIDENKAANRRAFTGFTKGAVR
jgi:hypothetical protein